MRALKSVKSDNDRAEDEPQGELPNSDNSDADDSVSFDEIPESVIEPDPEPVTESVIEPDPEPVQPDYEPGAEEITVIKSEEGTLLFKCPLCSFTTKFKANVERHKLARHSNKAFCSECQKLFNTREDLLRHRKTHHGSRDYLCDICSKTFKSRGLLRNHYNNVHETNKKFKCEICNKSFNAKAHFLGHLNTHSDTKPHECEHCKRGFTYITSYNRHVKLCKGSDGDREVPIFKCPECSLVLKNAQILREHMRGRHGETVHRCRCGKVFRWRASLFNHKAKCPCT